MNNESTQSESRFVLYRDIVQIRIFRLKAASLFALASLCLFLSPVSQASGCISELLGSSDFHQRLIDRAKIALVQIFNTTEDKKQFSGSGFFVGDQGLVVTNYHVVHNAKSLVIVHHNSGNQYMSEDLRVIDVDPIKDMALLKVKNIAFNAKLGPLNLKDCHEKVTENPEIIIVANNSKARNFVTTGIVGNRDSIFYVMRERMDVVAPANDNPYQYDILLFQNVVAPGNSGAPVFNKANGNIIGIVTGAVGRQEYAAFAIPIEYAVKFLADNEQEPGQPVEKLAEDGFVSINSEDPYYQLLNTYNSVSFENLISISGTVINTFSENPIPGARITIYDTRDSNLSFSQETDETGHYGFALPRSPKSRWQLTATHTNYELADKNETNLGNIDFDRNDLKTELIIKKEYAAQAAWFYVNPPFVKLKSKPQTVDIKYEYTEWGKPRRKSITSTWSLCRDDDSQCNIDERLEWLGVNKSRGDITERGGRLLIYRSTESDIDPLLQYEDLAIFAPEENRSTSLYVSGNQDKT